MTLSILRYSAEWEKKWDSFVLHSSANGTFLQTRRFLSYHPAERFTDASLLVLDGNNIVAVIPACEAIENGKRCFFSHRGSTFGGIVIDASRYNITTLQALFPLLEDYLRQAGYACAYFKPSSAVFCRKSPELMNYFFYQNGYREIDELSFVIDCGSLGDDITATWSSGRRRDYRYSLKNDLCFRRLNGDEELAAFYEILRENLSRHDAAPVHSLEELKEFRDSRFPEIVDLYGVFRDNELLAGSMLFYFDNKVLHTQYLAQRSDAARLFVMNYLNYHLIELAKGKGFETFSFGISTEERGRVLNTGLAVFKEGFGTQFCNNRSFYKEF